MYKSLLRYVANDLSKGIIDYTHTRYMGFIWRSNFEINYSTVRGKYFFDNLSAIDIE